MRNVFSMWMLCLSLLVAAGCGQYLNDSAPQQDSELSLDAGASDEMTAQVELLKNSEDFFDSYMKGNTEPEDISAFFDALEEVLTLFADNTKGADPDAYALDELYAFLNRYVLKDPESGKVEFDLSKSDLSAALTIKQLLIGGDADRITRSEFSAIFELMDVVEEEMIALNGLIPALEGSSAQREEAYEQLKESAEVFGQYIDGQESTATLKQVRELSESYLSAETKLDWDLLGLLKSIVVGGPRDSIESGEWARTLRAAIGGLHLAQIYTNDLKEFDSLDQNALSSMDQLVTLAIKTLREGLAYRTNSSLLISEIEELFSYVQGDIEFFQKMIIQPIRENCERLYKDIESYSQHCTEEGPLQLFTQTARTLIERFLEKANMGDAFIRGQISSRDLIYFQYIYQGWSDAQKVIARSFTNRESLTHSTFAADLKKFDQNKSSQPSLARFANLVSQERPVEFLGDKTRIQNPKTGQISQPGATRLNVTRTAAETILKAYAMDAERSKHYSGLKAAELNQFYKETRDLLVMIGMFDWRTHTVGERLFTEAQLFTYASDGDEFFEYTEATELILNLLSSGGVIGTRTLEALKSCEIENSRGGLGYPRLDAACVEAGISSAVAPHIDNHPRLQAHFNQASQNTSETFKTFLAMGKGDFSCPDSYEAGDIQAAVVIMSYMELVFTKFDLNYDEILDTEEINEAFPYLKEAMEEAAPVSGWASFALGGVTRALRSGLYFVLDFGRLPSTQEDNLTIADWAWNGHEIQPVTREKLLATFAVVMDSMDAETSTEFSAADFCQ